jgi:hypothetical protein
MLRRLQLFGRWGFSEGERVVGAPTARTEYLLLPTNFPVSPYYFYSTRINKHLYEFIQKHKIRYVAAFPVRPGVFRRPFYPHSLEDMESHRTSLPMQSDSRTIPGRKGEARLPKP